MIFKIKNEKLINKIINATKHEVNYEKDKLNYIELQNNRFEIVLESGQYHNYMKKEIAELIGDISVKRVLLTRRDILSDTFESKPNKMGAGKLSAQVGHAIEGLNFQMFRGNIDYKDYVAPEDDYTLEYFVEKGSAFAEYSEGSFTKIILTVKTETQFLNLYEKLKDNNINCVLIQDSGLTVFNNVPTYTFIGIEPEYSYYIDCFTSKYQLLK